MTLARCVVRKRKLWISALVAAGPLLVAGCASPQPNSPWGQTAEPSLSSRIGEFFGRSSHKSAMSGVTQVADDDPTRLATTPRETGPDLNVAWAKVHESGRRFAEAEHQYQLALKKAPHDKDALLGYAHLMDHQNKLERATELYQQAATKHPQDAMAHNDLGLCYHRRGMLHESAASLQRAVEIAPDKKLYRNNLATVLVDLQRPGDAYQHLLTVHGEAIAHYNLGCLVARKGDRRGAIGEYQQALAVNPSLAPARQALAQLAPAAAPPAERPMMVANNQPVVRSAPPRTAIPPRVEGPAVEVSDAPEPGRSPSYLHRGAAAPSGSPRNYAVRLPDQRETRADDEGAMPPMPGPSSVEALPPVE